MIIQERESRQQDNGRYPERRGVSNTSVIKEAKAKIPTIDLADRLAAERGGGWKKEGAEFRRLCVLPDHEERTPSFRVNPQKDVWFCDGCVRGGDSIELARLAWGYDKRDAGLVAGMLLLEFGFEVPKRPESWYRKLDRQAKARKALEDARIQRTARGFYRAWCAPGLAGLPPGPERESEEERRWDECEFAARLLVLQDRGGA